MTCLPRRRHWSGVKAAVRSRRTAPTAVTRDFAITLCNRSPGESKQTVVQIADYGRQAARLVTRADRLMSGIAPCVVTSPGPSRQPAAGVAAPPAPGRADEASLLTMAVNVEDHSGGDGSPADLSIRGLSGSRVAADAPVVLLINGALSRPRRRLSEHRLRVIDHKRVLVRGAAGLARAEPPHPCPPNAVRVQHRQRVTRSVGAPGPRGSVTRR